MELEATPKERNFRLMEDESIKKQIYDTLIAVEGHGKYHTSDYDGPVMTVADGLHALLELMKEAVPEPKKITEPKSMDVRISYANPKEDIWEICKKVDAIAEKRGFNKAIAQTLKNLGVE